MVKKTIKLRQTSFSIDELENILRREQIIDYSEYIFSIKYNQDKCKLITMIGNTSASK